jgi:hypothetical protein
MARTSRPRNECLAASGVARLRVLGGLMNHWDYLWWGVAKW